MSRVGRIDINLCGPSINRKNGMKTYWANPKTPRSGKWHKNEDELPVGQLRFDCQNGNFE